MAGILEFTGYLDELLHPSDFNDYTYNGLQVEGEREIRKAGFAVDTAYEVIKSAVDLGCDILVVHHALIWRPWSRVSGFDRERLKLLLENGIGLYVSHLPLDAHPEIGNNVEIARLLGAETAGMFYEVGRFAEFGSGIAWNEFAGKLEAQFGTPKAVMRFGSDTVGKFGICSGGIRSDSLDELHAAGVDTLLTGEGSGESQFYYPAREMKMNVVLAGHYATELPGIRRLKEKVAADVKDVETFLIDIPTGW